jgi:hypothetical protein
MKLACGVLLALLAAGALNLGFYVQHRAAHGMGLSLRHPLAGTRRLLTDRDWLIGYASAWLGWGFYVAALWMAPLSVVQSVAAGGVGLLALLAHRFGVPLVRRERWGAALAVGGLVLLCLSLPAVHRTASHDHSGQLLAVLIGGCALAAVAAAGGLWRRGTGWPLALAAGLFYAVGDLATKAVVDGQVLLFLPFMLGGAALAFVCLQLSFGRGPVMATAGLSSLVNNGLPIAGGLLLFHEAVGSGAAEVARLLGFACAVIGTVLLARQPKEPEPSEPETVGVEGRGANGAACAVEPDPPPSLLPRSGRESARTGRR